MKRPLQEPWKKSKGFIKKTGKNAFCPTVTEILVAINAAKKFVFEKQYGSGIPSRNWPRGLVTKFQLCLSHHNTVHANLNPMRSRIVFPRREIFETVAFFDDLLTGS